MITLNLNFSPENVRLFDGTAANPEEECRSVEKFICAQTGRGGINYLVLGTGLNGHLALNEPGSSFESGARVVGLDETTKQVGQKYFRSGADLSGGLTLGLRNFSCASRSVLMVSGQHKRGILRRIIDGPISEDIPATAIRGFNNAGIYCDREAYGPE